MTKSRMTRSGLCRGGFREPSLAVARLAHPIALLLERRDDEVANVGIVIDHEDRSRRSRLACGLDVLVAAADRVGQGVRVGRAESRF